MQYEETITVPASVAEQIRALCNSPPGRDRVARDEVAEFISATFSNGWIIDVKVVATNEPDEEPCWTEAVLLRPVKEGVAEVAHTEPGEGVFGEWILQSDEDTYTLNIVEEG